MPAMFWSSSIRRRTLRTATASPAIWFRRSSIFRACVRWFWATPKPSRLPQTPIRSLVDAERRQLAARLTQHRAKVDGLEQQIAAKMADRDQAKAIVEKIDASVPLLQAKAQVYEQLLQKELTSKIAWLEAERQLSEERHDRVVAAHRLERDEAEADFRHQALDELSKATQYAADQREELVKAAQRTGLQTLRAPVGGTVEQLAVHTIGGVVTPAQTLLVIVPDGSKLEVEALLPNRDAGFVHAGQPAELKVEAFSYTRYGL